MMQQPDNTDLILSARVLGALFYTSPESDAAAPLVAALRDGSWQAQWPTSIAYRDGIAARLQAGFDEPLAEAWQRLFIGPYALPASPWGSVWLDKENVLFGESTLALRQWLRDNSIAFHSGQNEPEDHFGLLLMLGAWLLENQQEARWQELLAWHLLPWSGRFLDAFVAKSDHPFYCALGQLAQDTLAAWQTRLRLPVAIVNN
ncbi:Tat proofreading chaperone DmsD [Pluralibacter gergoviae]